VEKIQGWKKSFNAFSLFIFPLRSATFNFAILPSFCLTASPDVSSITLLLCHSSFPFPSPALSYLPLLPLPFCPLLSAASTLPPLPLSVCRLFSAASTLSLFLSRSALSYLPLLICRLFLCQFCRLYSAAHPSPILASFSAASNLQALPASPDASYLSSLLCRSFLSQSASFLSSLCIFIHLSYSHFLSFAFNPIPPLPPSHPLHICVPAHPHPLS
jgi:hypothetical protein